MEDFWYGMEMEWKKIASMEYGKIVFHSIPYHALPVSAQQHQLLRPTIAPVSTLAHNKKFVISSASRDYIEEYHLTKI